MRNVLLLAAATVVVSCGGTPAADPAELEAAQLEALADEWANDPRTLAEQEVEPRPDLFAFGQELRITDEGPYPVSLVVIREQEVDIRNETAEPVQLVFVNGPVGADELTETPPIAPGETFTFVPTRAVSITYHLAGKPETRGHLQVDTGVDF